MPAPEALNERHQKGVQAAHILTLILPFIEAREQQLVTLAVGSFRAGRMDGVGALSSIAALSEVRAFREELEHRIRQGERAANELVKETP